MSLRGRRTAPGSRLSATRVKRRLSHVAGGVCLIASAQMTRYAEASNRRGEERTPGISRLRYTDPPICPSPFANMMMANGYASHIMKRLPRNAIGDTERAKKTPRHKPVSHTRNVKTGSGKKGNRLRMAWAVGLYTDRKSVAASSATCSAKATHKQTQAIPNRRPSSLISSLAIINATAA